MVDDIIEMVADFETTTGKVSTDHTKVWSAAYIELDKKCHPDNVTVVTSLDKFMYSLFDLDSDIRCWFFNLKFDGSFILDWLLRHPEYECLTQDGKLMKFKGKKGREALRCFENSFTYCVNDMGVWYSITIVHNWRIIQFVDQAKLFPGFTLAKLADSFETQYRKLEMDYDEHTDENQEISYLEMDYIKNDVLIQHELQHIMFANGHTKTTIGSCCWDDLKKDYKSTFRKVFPDLTKVECPVEGYDNADAYIRKSYHGGFCMVNPKIQNKIVHNGITVDANSHYPSQMRLREYPFGLPTWFEGAIPEKAYNKYYFVRVRCHFDLKPNMIPTVQIKGSGLYPSNEWLSTDRINGVRYYINLEDKMVSTKQTLTFTCTDWELFCEHYDIEELEFLDGCYFNKTDGLFDAYIDKWGARKVNAKDAVEKQLAKLFLNNAYGQLSKGSCSDYSIFDICGGSLHASRILDNDKESGYIACGSAITSYCRERTITFSQQHYDNWAYCDTDSLHLFDTKPEDVTDIPLDPKKLGYWGVEACWKDAKFVRQKTYIEYNYMTDMEECEPFYDIKCAGMGKGPKATLKQWLSQGYKKISEADEVFVEPFALDDFKVGLEIDGNLKSKRVEGGTLLIENKYKMR